MKMSEPAPVNALDQNRQGLIGKPVDRVDGRLKVTGQAPYAYEVQERPAGQPAAVYGFLVEASVGKARIARIDTSEAERAPGVRLVMTHLNSPPQAPFGPLSVDRFRRAKPQLADDQVQYYGQPVALVVADEFEQARSASRLVRIEYEDLHGEFDMLANLSRAEVPDSSAAGRPDNGSGDVGTALTEAPVVVDAMFHTPYQIHAPMEPHASLAWWDGDRVTIHCSTQMIESAQACVAATLRIDASNVRVVGRYIGGGFGGKLPIYGDALLAAMASRQLGRPVKIALTRQQMFHVTTHRSATVQRVQLGATRDGLLTAISHEAWAHSARFDNFFEGAANVTRTLYAAPNRITRHRRVMLDLPVAESMRAPGEAVGMLALECAMDEMAEKLGIDPVELRLRNEPAIDPDKKIPYSTRQLVECLREGARRFGWDQRNRQPGQTRDGRWLIGHGMAAASRNNYLRPASCRVSLGTDGRLTVRMGMTDIGTGSYTVFAQIAAEMMGLPLGKVDVLLGDSDFPPTPGAGGSFGAASAGSALYDACDNLRQMLSGMADVDPATAVFADGMVHGQGQGHAATLADLASRAGPDGMAADGVIKPGDMGKQYSQQAYGAHFCEVGVDADTGEVRVRRMLGVFAAGRILNEKTAASQVLGGMAWGIGTALHEDAVLDTRHGQFVNHDLAEYHLPAHADVPDIEVVFLPEVDDKANPLKIKGVGELGICGAGAAVANAIYNACGVRARDFPITLDKLIAGMPETAR